MLDNNTLSDLNKAFTSAPNGFLVSDQGQPSFAVLPYRIYKALTKSQPRAEVRKTKKILVTGGAGYIGSHTVKELLDQGYEVVVLDNLSTGRKEAVGDAKLIIGDLNDRELLDQVFADERFDAVMHFASSLIVEESVADPAKYYENNLVNGLNLLNAMVEYHVPSLVFSSSAAVYGEPESIPVDETSACQPTNPYGETKLDFERALGWYQKAYGLNSVSLRYFNAAGASPEFSLGYNLELEPTHLIPRVLEAALGVLPELLVFGDDYDTPDGTCVRDYIHVQDLARAHLSALQLLENEDGAHVFNVGTGSGHTVMEIIDEVMEVTGRMLPLKVVGRRAGDPARLIANSQKLQTTLGWRPEHDLRSIIQSSWEWQKNS